MPSPGTLISSSTFNVAQTKLQDIMGLGEDGYGIPFIASNPITDNNFPSVQDWQFFLRDINTVHRHITNQNTSSFITINNTQPLYASTATNAFATTDWLYESSRRWTCHPLQFFSTGTDVAPTTSTFNYGGVSTRTLAWGIEPNVISHEIVAIFPTRLRANYYFNLGSYLTFDPFAEGTSFSDLDNRWLSFINYMNNSARKYKYDRAKFQNNSNLTTYNSGTLSVSILAEKINSGKDIKFTITFNDSDNSNVYVNPTGYAWKILV